MEGTQFAIENQVASRLSELSKASSHIEEDAKGLEELSGAKYTKGLGASTAELLDPLTLDLAVMKTDLAQLPKEALSSGNKTRIMEELSKLLGLARKLEGLDTTPPIVVLNPAPPDNVADMELVRNGYENNRWLSSSVLHDERLIFLKKTMRRRQSPQRSSSSIPKSQIMSEHDNRLSLCSNGCGFFGSRETCNLCSKCYKAHVQPEPPAESEESAPPLPVVDPPTLSDAPVEVAPEIPVQKNKNRCWQCNARVGVVGLSCKCGFIFCAAHRYPETHACSFDFKAHDRRILAAKAVRVAPSKVTPF